MTRPATALVGHSRRSRGNGRLGNGRNDRVGGPGGYGSRGHGHDGFRDEEVVREQAFLLHIFKDGRVLDPGNR